MSPRWENPNYARSKHWRNLVFGLVAVAFAFVLLLFLLRSSEEILEKKVARQRPQPGAAAASLRDQAPTANAGGAAQEKSTPALAAEAGLDLSTPPPARSEEEAARHQQARQSFDSGDYERAVSLLQELRRSNRRYGQDLGLVYYKMNKLAQAVEVLLDVVSADPGNFMARKILALAYYQQNDLENCEAQIRAALALQPDEQLAGLLDKLGREVKVQKDYIDAKTSQFNVLFDGREHEEIRTTVIDLLNTAYRSIGNDFDHFPGEPVTVILYSDKDFTDVTHAPEWAGGLYDGKIRIPVRGVIGQEDLLRRVVNHEYVHALVRSLTPRCPRWLNEGLAEYFSEPERVLVEQRIPLEHLDRVLMAADPRVARLAYAECLNAVTEMIDRYGLYRVKELLLYMGQNESLEDAFQKALAVPFSQYAARWRRE